MGSISRTSEIVESEGQLDLMHHAKSLNPIKVKPRVDERARKHLLPTAERSSIEDELNQLIEAIDIKTRGLTTSDKSDKSSLGKNPQKRPIRVGISQASEIRISEAVTLKQALRGLCISQASEIAAMKRLTKPRFITGAPESGTIKRLYRAVVVEANESVVPFSGEAKGSVVEVSIVPEKSTPSSSEEITETLQIPKVNQNVTSSVPNESIPTAGPKKSTLFSPRLKTKLSQVPEVAVSKQKDVSSPNFAAAITSIKTKKSSQDPASSEVGSKTPTVEPRMKGKLNSTSVSNASSGVRKLGPGSGVIRPVVFRNKSFAKKKLKEESNSSTGSSHLCPEAGTLASQAESHKKNSSINSISPATSSTSPNVEVSSNNMVSVTSKPDVDAKCSKVGGTVALKMADSITSREKGESYQSSNSSIGEYSSSTSISDESNLSGSSCNVSRPHMSKDSRWEAIRHVEMKHGNLGLKHFKLLKRLGCGDIGTVYLAELTGSTVMFALKVMDNDFLASRKKMPRAQTEREILQMLDHPFLPTLYTHFTTDKLSCLVMEYCPGGDLHVLRQKQPGRNFHEQAARFYAAEVLLALEYLHMLGVVYRDLKPENILVREDGHIMLSDFDLSLRCAVSPSLVKSSSPPSAGGAGKRESGPCVESPCIDPLCLQPSWVQMSCFTPRLISTPSKKRKPKSEVAGSAEGSPLPQLVAEPTEARSNSFVGTHEYLAPEIIKGEGHGSAVDWWTFGIFVYELLFGTTPFKGASGNEETLANVVSQNLKFPEGSPAVSFSARDLIRGLLVKEPENRLGSVRGATEIKQHPFFEGLNWALIRCAIPPETPKGCQLPPESRKKESKCLEFKSIGEHLEFELF